MSYCRFADGDVYLYRSEDSEWTCGWCKLEDGEHSVVLDTPLDVLLHLDEHRVAGHEFPAVAADRAAGDFDDWFGSAPAPELVGRVLELYFPERPGQVNVPISLDFLLGLPDVTWQARFLEITDTLSKAQVLDRTGPAMPSFLDLLDEIHRFEDREACQTLVDKWLSWALEEQSANGPFALKALSEEEALTDKFLRELFGKGTPTFEDVIAQLEAAGDRLASEV